VLDNVGAGLCRTTRTTMPFIGGIDIVRCNPAVRHSLTLALTRAPIRPNRIRNRISKVPSTGLINKRLERPDSRHQGPGHRSVSDGLLEVDCAQPSATAIYVEFPGGPRAHHPAYPPRTVLRRTCPTSKRTPRCSRLWRRFVSTQLAVSTNEETETKTHRSKALHSCHAT
jgi:hypothetical protein